MRDLARKGAPNAIQIADRFHVLRNLGEALQKLLHRHAAVLKEALAAAIESNALSSPQPASSPSCRSSGEETLEPSSLSEAAPEERACQTVRQLLYEEARVLHERGMTIMDISRTTGMDRKTVRKYLRL